MTVHDDLSIFEVEIRARALRAAYTRQLFAGLFARLRQRRAVAQPA